MHVLEVGWRSMNWMDLAQDRNKWQALVRAVMKIRVPQNPGNFLISYGAVIFSERNLLHGVVS